MKYFFEFTDTIGIQHRCEIYYDGFVGTATEVDGNVILNKVSSEDNLECIRGGGLKVILEANKDLTFEDLYSEEERTVSVKYFRNSTLIFYGWLDPEGLFEDYVNENWEISLNCKDSLGFLRNLSYVNATGLNFTGKQTALEIISNCLKRGGLEQDIYISVNVYYTGLSTSLDVFANYKENAERFIKDDDSTVMNADEVLRSVLEKFNACITQKEGAWYVFRPNEFVSSQNVDFFAYDYNGVALNPTTKTVNLLEQIGAQIDGYSKHHVNENQQKTIASSLGAYRVSYKYGLVQSFVDNVYLKSITDTDIPDYTIIDGTDLTFPSDRVGIKLNALNDSNILETSDTLSLSAGDGICIAGEFTTSGDAVYLQMIVELDGTTKEYLLKDGTWGASGTIRIYNGEPFANATPPEQEFVGTDKKLSFEIKSDPLPQSGDVKIILKNAGLHNTGGDNNGQVFLQELRIEPSQESNNLEGETHTFQRTTKPSSKIESPKEVFTGDNPSDIYIGTLYKADGTTPTDTWFRDGITEAKSILQLMGEDRLRMNSKPMKVFSGDVYGYIDYLCVIQINNISGLFMPIEYSYNAKENEVNLKSKEILNENILDIDYQVNLDYGEVVEPTIKG